HPYPHSFPTRRSSDLNTQTASTVQLPEHGHTTPDGLPQTRHNSTRVTAAIAEGKRPDPSRTRKLSPPAPMVLHPPGCGRVGHRRDRKSTRLNSSHSQI